MSRIEKFIIITLSVLSLAFLGQIVGSQRQSVASVPPKAQAIPARAVPAKPIDPAVEAQRLRENEAKWQHVRKNPGSFCETFKSELTEFTGVKSPCLK